jgi:hypothetical protein
MGDGAWVPQVSNGRDGGMLFYVLLLLFYEEFLD